VSLPTHLNDFQSSGLAVVTAPLAATFLTATGLLTTLLSTTLTASALFVAGLLPTGIFASLTIWHYCFPPWSIGHWDGTVGPAQKSFQRHALYVFKTSAQPCLENCKQSATTGGIAIVVIEDSVLKARV
jgi:hypothetical protein